MKVQTKKISVGDVFIGGGTTISIQSMTNTFTEDVAKTVAQIRELTVAGCEIIRVAVPNMVAALAIKKIKSQISIPLVADIHFDHRLALQAIEGGVDKVRINPGNIGNAHKVKEVITALKSHKIPIRIGVNSGSVDKKFLAKFGGPTPMALVESALSHVALLEQNNFDDIIISIKSSSVVDTIKAYRLMSEKVVYPLHLGVTELGTFYHASIKSAMGIGSLLVDGIGDTLRVSLTGDPIKEIKLAKGILAASERRRFGINIVACPTCGRCNIPLANIAEEVEIAFSDIDLPITIAVMGCAVNGPGEAREADLGVAGGKGEALIFKKGKILKKVPYQYVVAELKQLIEDWSDTA